MKNLIFCSAAIHLPYYSHEVRENEYFYCLMQLKRVLPKNFEIVICDNTITDIKDLQNPELKNLLKNEKFLILNRNIGSQNIGMGELDELIYVSENIDFNNYDKIVYFTLRKIVTTPWIFEKVNSMKKTGLISNPQFLHMTKNFNFKIGPPTPNLFNDMFFALTASKMLEYVKYSKQHINFNIQNQIGSEQNLFNFVKENNLDYDSLEFFGLIRIDYKCQNEIQLI